MVQKWRIGLFWAENKPKFGCAQLGHLLSDFDLRPHQNDKGPFTYYVITKGEGVRNDYAYVVFALSSVKFG